MSVVASLYPKSTAARCGFVLLALVMGVLGPRPGQARDEVDAAFVAGNEAAAQRRWSSAVRHYERARKLNPGRSAQLSYNLGTAYAHLGKVGYATVHLHHALDQSSDRSLSEAARQNLGLLRRRAETMAAASGRVLSEPAHWSSVVVAFLGTTAIGCLSLLLWWLAAGLALWRLRKGPGARRTWALPLWITAAALLLSALYLFSRAQLNPGEFIVVGDTVALRDGPGQHREMLFEVQPSSRVSVLQRSSGWAQVRLPGARQGWIVSRALAPLQPWAASIPVGLGEPAPGSKKAEPGR